MCIRYQKRCLIITAIFIFYITIYYLRSANRANTGSIDLPYVVVHLDLKGMPPKISYLITLLPYMKTLGANGLLMEYEDMFPYDQNLRNLSSKYAYSKEDLSDFLKAAHANGLEIIPLVQTFGHMEFALKLAEFQNLRENPYYAESICPSNSESRMLLKYMLQQVIDFHSGIVPLKHFHIGCDEVYNINMCPACTDKNLPKLKLYIEHVNNVYSILKSIRPNVSVLIWDDMISQVHHTALPTINSLKQVEPVHWHYLTEIKNPHTKLMSHKKKFKHTWIATAFKGADGRTGALPDLTARFQNNFNWLKLMYDYGDIYRFKGIILTGWSRYGHMDPPCEPLPAAMPSLALNLLLARKFKSGFELNGSEQEWDTFYNDFIQSDFKNELACSRRQKLDLKYNDILICRSEYTGLVEAMYQFDKFRKKIIRDIYSDRTGLYSVKFYNKAYKTVSRNSYFWRNTVKQALDSVKQHKIIIKSELKKYFNSSFIDEFVDYKTDYLMKLLNSLSANLREFESIRSWKRHGD